MDYTHFTCGLFFYPLINTSFLSAIFFILILKSVLLTWYGKYSIVFVE